MCNIIYSSLVFDETAGTITLRGSADCSSVTASIVSPQMTNPVSVPVDASGTWEVIFSGNDITGNLQQLRVACNRDVKVHVHCTQDPNCVGNRNILLQCIPSGVRCPDIDLSVKEIARDCVNGTRAVTFIVGWNNPVSPSFYEIAYGDGEDDALVYNGGQNPVEITHNYASGGRFTVVVTSNFPENCPSSNTVTVDVPPCDGNCPTVRLELVSVSGCLPDGTRTATFRVAVSNVPPGTSVYEIAFGDGADENIAFDSNTSGPMVITHNYAEGNYSAVVNSFLPAGCPSSNPVLVDIPPCTANCATDVAFEVIDSTGNRFRVVANSGTFEAVTNNPGQRQVSCFDPGRYIIRVTDPGGSGLSYVWREDENPPVESNSADFAVQLSNTNKTVTVIVKKAGCTDLAETVTLPVCEQSCCPELTGLEAGCLVRCPANTTATLTATGTDLDCAEAFSWDFGDGTTEETSVPTVTHRYPDFSGFRATVTMVRPGNCGNRVQQASVGILSCCLGALCQFLTYATTFLLLALLMLMPIIACTSDPTLQQGLIIALIVVTSLLTIFWLWWLLDPCCRPTRCEMLRILFWVLSWALIGLGLLALANFCTSLIPFGLGYVVAQQIILNRINAFGCNPGAPDTFSWPFLDYCTQRSAR